MNRREVNCVPLPVVRSRWCRGFPQADAQARWNRFQLTISLVQQSITLTRCAQPTVGPAQISSCPTFRFDSARRLLRVPWCSQTPRATTNLRSRITRNTRFRFTGGFSFRRNHQVTRRYPYGGFSSACHDDLFVILPVRSAPQWLLLVIQTRPA